jgi:hypothetical protein
LVLNKYTVTYYHCSKCGFIQTEKPYWVEESYSKAIATADTGIMMRNFSNASSLLFLMKFLKSNSACLDFGGGHGILTRIMRDYGFDFYHFDKYAENLFATGFEGSLEKKYDLVTSFENFEHFVNPLEEIKRIINMTDVLYFSTALLPQNLPLVKNWWYYVPSTGQHISFYSKKTLKFIATKFNMYLLTDSDSSHILSGYPINKKYFFYSKVYNKVNAINIQRVLKRKTKTVDDMNKIILANHE